MVQETDDEGGYCGDQKTVKTIHQAAMAGNEPARIFDAKAPLNGGFGEVAQLRQRRKRQSNRSYRREVPDTVRIGDHDAAGNPPSQAAEGPCPRLVWADLRPQ